MSIKFTSYPFKLFLVWAIFASVRGALALHDGQILVMDLPGAVLMVEEVAEEELTEEERREAGVSPMLPPYKFFKLKLLANGRTFIVRESLDSQ